MSTDKTVTQILQINKTDFRESDAIRGFSCIAVFAIAAEATAGKGDVGGRGGWNRDGCGGADYRVCVVEWVSQ